MAYRLPMVHIYNRVWTVDVRLGEIRYVDNPGISMQIDNVLEDTVDVTEGERAKLLEVATAEMVRVFASGDNP